MTTPLGEEIDRLKRENGTLKFEITNAIEKICKSEERHETELVQAFAWGAVVTFLLIVAVFVIVYLVW
jgi:hypothetical protein